MVKAFRALDEFKELMAKYNIDAYLVRLANYFAKVEALFPSLEVA